MNPAFQNRAHAGRLLGERLASYANRDDVVVLALPRGGVPVGFAVAQRLDAPLDVFVVRKLGVPGHPEVAMGAIATGGVRVLNDVAVFRLQIPRSVIERVALEEERELRRREHAYRGHGESTAVAGRIVVLVDDGLATGSTMSAAAQGLRQQQPAKLIVAVPVASVSAAKHLRAEADDFVALLTPHEFNSVGEWYADFSQTTDAEVTELLDQARQRHQATAGDQ